MRGHLCRCLAAPPTPLPPSEHSLGCPPPWRAASTPCPVPAPPHCQQTPPPPALHPLQWPARCTWSLGCRASGMAPPPRSSWWARGRDGCCPARNPCLAGLLFCAVPPPSPLHGSPPRALPVPSTTRTHTPSLNSCQVINPTIQYALYEWLQTARAKLRCGLLRIAGGWPSFRHGSLPTLCPAVGPWQAAGCGGHWARRGDERRPGPSAPAGAARRAPPPPRCSCCRPWPRRAPRC